MVAVDHVAHHVLGQLDRGADVEVDQPQLVLERRVGGERAPRPDAGIERHRFDGTPGGGDVPV